MAAYEQAIPLLHSRGERESEAAALNNIGKIYFDLGEWQEASDHYQEALPIFHETGDRAREGIALKNLGDVSLLTGQNEKALEYYRRALPLHRAAADKGSEADTLRQTGSVYRALGRSSRGNAASTIRLWHLTGRLAITGAKESHYGSWCAYVDWGKAAEGAGKSYRITQMLHHADDARAEKGSH